MNTLEFARNFVSYLETGNYEKARDSYQPDCKIWHSHDNYTQTVDENLALLDRMLSVSEKIEYIINRLEIIENGYLQLHTLKMTAKDGKSYSTEACLVATLRDGKLSEVKEWIDAAPLAPIFA